MGTSVRPQEVSLVNCFNHRTASAVGICKSCGKGVCPACASDTGHGLACLDSCEDRVALLGRMVDNNARVLRAANAQTRSSGLFAVVLGVAFLGFAWWIYTAGNMFLALLCAVFGLPFAFFGLVRLFAERFPRPDE